MTKYLKDLCFKETASFDVDAEKGFTDLTGELPVPDGENIVEALNKQAKFGKYRIGSKDAHPPGAIYFTSFPSDVLTPILGDNKNMDVLWPPHCRVGTKGFELLDGLPAPVDYSFFVYKGLEINVHPYGACYHDLAETQSTGVIEFLRDKGVKTVIIGGLALDYCVFITAMQLKRAGFDVIINLIACRGLASDSVDAAIKQMRDKNIWFVDDDSEDGAIY